MRGVIAATLLAVTATRLFAAEAELPDSAAQQLNQGWTVDEIRFFATASEGSNLAPLEFLLHLPDSRNPEKLFLDRAEEYGFIPGERCEENPHKLPVGLAIDDAPTAYGDRAYVGLTCSACHTRVIAVRTGERDAPLRRLAVHGGPSLVDVPRFDRDLYDAFAALLQDEARMRRFCDGVEGRAASDEEIASIRAELEELLFPVMTARAIAERLGVPFVHCGPGNLNALTQGYYNNLALGASLKKRGLLSEESAPPRPARYEGADNYPPMWFAPSDDWVQWFAEIHHPGPRNWIQSAATSPIRPPKFVAHWKEAAIVASIRFDNVSRIQRSLERLRAPKWPEDSFGQLDRTLVEEGASIYRESCASCHDRPTHPPNHLGIEFFERRAFDVGTDPTAYFQFKEHADAHVEGLKKLSEAIIAFRRKLLLAQHGPELVENYVLLESRGRPNVYDLAPDYGAADTSHPKSGAAYWAPPLEGVFATSPYLHNGSVRTLEDLLLPASERESSFRTGTNVFDPVAAGLESGGDFDFDTSQSGKGNDGHEYGVDLPAARKKALLEYLKSL